MEIILIGSKTCPRCEMTKNILKGKNIEYKYVLMEELKEEERNKYIEMAKDQGVLSMPLIVKNEKIITLQEV